MTDAWNSKCSRCGSPNSYEGFNGQECPTESCSNFSTKQKQLVQKEFADQDAAEREYDQEQNNLGTGEENLDAYGSCMMESDPDPKKKADTDAPGPPDDYDDDSDAYLWGLYDPKGKHSPRKAVVPPKPPAKENDDDYASYFPYELPADISLD